MDLPDPATVAGEDRSQPVVRRPPFAAGGARGRKRPVLAVGLAVAAAPSDSGFDDRPADTEADSAAADAMLVRLDGFEGPLDLLLDLARRQQVDLAQISVLALVDQYLAALDRLGVAATRLARAADWLVMAAWLTWLKSRLLLPQAAPDAARAAGALVDRLAQMERVRALAAWLDARPQLGRDTHPRGAPEISARTVVSDLPVLFEACLVGLRWEPPVQQTWRLPRPILWRVPDALGRLRALIGTLPDGSELMQFFPPQLFAPAPAEMDRAAAPPRADLQRRGAVASTLVGALELARETVLHLCQDAPFGPIRVHAVSRGDDPGTAQHDRLAETA
jgi:segregation and condensation protein A